MKKINLNFKVVLIVALMFTSMVTIYLASSSSSALFFGVILILLSIVIALVSIIYLIQKLVLTNKEILEELQRNLKDSSVVGLNPERRNFVR